jgi:hypothetical protein
MELLPPLRALWRRRLLIVPGVLCAIAFAVLVAHKTPPSSLTMAWTRVMLDTPKSQTVETVSDAGGTLPWRASLLVHLMATTQMRKELAAKAGVPDYEVAVIDPELAVPLVKASVPQKAGDAAAAVHAPYVLTPQLINETIPLVSLEAVAPTASGARRLAAAAVAVLKAHGSAGGRYRSAIYTGAGANVLEKFGAAQVAPIRTVVTRTSTGAAMGAVAGFCVLIAWCAALVVGPRLLRRGRPVRRMQPA